MLKSDFEGREITLGFDYGLIAAEDRDFVIAAALKIQFYTSMAASAVATAGGCLREVKDRLPGGQFLEWLDAEFELISERTARRWMAIHQMAVSRTDDFTVLDGFELKALYLLTQRVVSDGIRDAAFRHVLDGQKITHKMVTEMVGVAYGRPKLVAPVAPPVAPPRNSHDQDRDWTRPPSADYSGQDVEDDDERPRVRPVGGAPPPATPHRLTPFLQEGEPLLHGTVDDIVATIHPKFCGLTADKVDRITERLEDISFALREKAVKVAA